MVLHALQTALLDAVYQARRQTPSEEVEPDELRAILPQRMFLVGSQIRQFQANCDLFVAFKHVLLELQSRGKVTPSLVNLRAIAYLPSLRDCSRASTRHRMLLRRPLLAAVRAAASLRPLQPTALTNTNQRWLGGPSMHKLFSSLSALFSGASRVESSRASMARRGAGKTVPAAADGVADALHEAEQQEAPGLSRAKRGRKAAMGAAAATIVAPAADGASGIVSREAEVAAAAAAAAVVPPATSGSPPKTPSRKKASRRPAAPSLATQAALPSLQAKGQKIAELLGKLYPQPPIPLDHGSHFQLLCAVVLSAQTTGAWACDLPPCTSPGTTPCPYIPAHPFSSLSTPLPRYCREQVHPRAICARARRRVHGSAGGGPHRRMHSHPGAGAHQGQEPQGHEPGTGRGSECRALMGRGAARWLAARPPEGHHPPTRLTHPCLVADAGGAPRGAGAREL